MGQTKHQKKAVINRCPVSGSHNVVPLCEVDGFDVFRCPDSATDFVYPTPSIEELNEIYNDPKWFTAGLKGGYSDYDEQTAPSLEKIAEYFDRFPDKGKGLSILDVGCGYGSHLKQAFDLGWNCYGVEPSSHARDIAAERYGKDLTIVETAEELLPRQFDLILMLDVIEHLGDPYKLFFTLFGRGAIGPDTLIVISTPNARSFDALAEPAEWVYRHPPSHLVFYSAKSFEVLARRLLFSKVSVQGVVGTQHASANGFEDEGLDEDSGKFAGLGLLVELSGSHFKSFMHERYVPGGFWALTEYEHMPRYSFAAGYAKGAKVLDLGCGTGYGSSGLADSAESVLGVDISNEAIEWARDWHIKPGLEFEIRDDLGEGLPAASFDLVTNFEMIEHVTHEMQIQTVKSIARLLKPSGKMIMSTPDPRYTASYGVNPYHLREMTLEEFTELLEPHFKHIRIMRQWVRPSIMIGDTSVPEGVVQAQFGTLDDGEYDSMVGYVAICSHEPFETPPYYCQFDTKRDFNLATLKTEHVTNDLRLEAVTLAAEKALLEERAERAETVLEETRAWTEKLDTERQAMMATETTYKEMIEERDEALKRAHAELGIVRSNPIMKALMKIFMRRKS